MDKYFKFDKMSKYEIAELVRWKEQDVKGRKKNQYIKKITNMNDQIMKVADLDELEKLVNYEDRWPCLNCRKSLMKVRTLIVIACDNMRKHYLFETASICVIMINCVTLAMEDPTAKEETQADLIWEYTFQGLYTVEMVIKIFGMGLFWNEGSYLRDAFNILDFIIIMSAYLTMVTPLLESMAGTEAEAPAI